MGIKNFILATFFSCVACFCSGDPDDDETPCTEEFVYGLNVTVKNADNNAIITEGLTVIAREGSYEEELMLMIGSDVFLGAGEREGIYIIEITSNNYQTYISEAIDVIEDICHVITQNIEVLLLPN